MGFILTGATYTPNKLLKRGWKSLQWTKTIHCTVNKYENSTLQSFGTVNVVVICWCLSLVVFGKSLTVLSWRPSVGDSTSLRLLLLPFRAQLSALWKKKKNHKTIQIAMFPLLCRDLPDDPKAKWSIALVSSLIMKHLRTHSFNMVCDALCHFLIDVIKHSCCYVC